jgi:hypothetical protein
MARRCQRGPGKEFAVRSRSQFEHSEARGVHAGQGFGSKPGNGGLPTHALIDFEIGGWLGLGGVEKRCLIALGWGFGWAARGCDEGWIDRLTDIFEDARDRGGLDHKGDDAQLGAALWAEQGKDFVDARQEHGPEVGARPVVGGRLRILG